MDTACSPIRSPHSRLGGTQSNMTRVIVEATGLYGKCTKADLLQAGFTLKEIEQHATQAAERARALAAATLLERTA